MNLKVNKDYLELIENEHINAKAIDYYYIEIEFSEEWENLSKKIVYINGLDVYEGAIVNNKTVVPSLPSGEYSIGIVGILIEEDTIVKRISTNLLDKVIKRSTAEYETNQEISEEEASTYERYLQAITEKSIEIKETADRIDGFKEDIDKAYEEVIELGRTVDERKEEITTLAEQKEAELNNIADTARDMVSAVTFSQFGIDLEDMEVYIDTPEKLGNAGFSINDEGELEVEINEQN